MSRLPSEPSPLARRPTVAAGIRMLEAWIESQMAYRQLPGLSAGIVCDQELVWSRGFGAADLRENAPATAETLYRIASISKLFTATAIMQLRDRGRLGLDDPVRKHLPWFRIGKGREDDARVTIRQLLTHTAGLPREAAFPYWTDLSFPTEAQVRAGLARQQAPYPPAVKWKYSNLGLAIAGEVVAAAAGQPYARYVHQEILEPLGMDQTGITLTPEQRARLATGYGRRMAGGSRAVRPFTETHGIAPAAGICSSVADLARFAALQFRDAPAGGPQVLAGPTLREMHRVQWLRPDWKGGWGIGFAVAHQDERDLVGHGGWAPGFQSSFQCSLAEKVAVIALFNADDGNPGPGRAESLVDRAFRWVAPPLAAAARPAPTRRALPPGWRKYVGIYRNAWADFRVLRTGEGLAMMRSTELDPDVAMVALVPLGEHAFRSESSGPFVEDGDVIRFELAGDRVVRLRYGENYAARVRR